MADDLASLLAGGSPILPAEMQALNAENQLAIANDPSKWQNMGIFGGLAHMMAQGQAQSQLQAALPQITAARTAALPDLARAYAAPDPYQWVAANPDADSLARWAVLNQTPLQVAAGKNALADTMLRRTQAGQLAWQLQNRMSLPSVFGGAAPGTTGSAPGALPPATPLMPGSLGSGRFPGVDTAGAASGVASTDLTGGSAASEAAAPTAGAPFGIDKVQPGGYAAYFSRLTPLQRSVVLTWLRQRAYLAPPPFAGAGQASGR